MKTAMKWIVAAVALGMGNHTIACSCEPVDLRESLDSAHAVIVAVPVSAQVVEVTGNPRGEIHARLKLLDVIKGVPPEELPIMVGRVEPWSGCPGYILLGNAQVFFLESDSTQLQTSMCGPNKVFSILRKRQERVCHRGHHMKAKECADVLLEGLRAATNANAMYGFDDAWMAEQERTTGRQILERNAAKRSLSPQQGIREAVVA